MRHVTWSRLLIVLLAAAAAVALCAKRPPVQGQGQRLAAAPPALEIVFLDVGQGDAALIVSRDGRRMLVDAGPRGSGVAAYLRSRGIDTLDLVVASHNHADHIGGLREVFAAVTVRNYMENSLPATTVTYQRLVDAVARSGARVLQPTARRLTLGTMSVEVLPAPPDAATQNDRSVGLLVRFGDFRALFTGDAELRQIGYWLEGGMLPQVSVVKISHHGSWNGTTAALVRATQPSLAVVSLGAGNQYGHPHASALRRWNDGGRQLLRTDQHGTITIHAAADGTMRVSTTRGAPPLRDVVIAPSAAAEGAAR